jgi:CBS domain containing-hemolysin-like protein
VRVKDLERPVNFVQDDTPLPELFKRLTKERQHLFMVTDEFGSIVGLVTMEDLFETLLGHEIIDESDKVADLQDLARKNWEKKK